MARATTDTLLPLDTWAQIMGISPWEFNQIDVSTISNGQCQSVFYQYEWQKDYLSREEIARAIARAEAMIADQLGYWPAPKYTVNEVVYLGQNSRLWPYRASHFYNGHYGNYYSVQTRWQRVLGGGRLARTLIGDTVNLTISDADGDGVDDTFACSIATTVTDANEIGVYFRSADRVPAASAIGEQWRIRPVTVSIAGGVATITGHCSLLVKPNLTTGADPDALEPNTSSNFVSQVTVYRVYRDSEQAGTAYWQPIPGDCSTEPCVQEARTLNCITEHNAKMGQVGVSYDDGCCTGWRLPDTVSLSYLSGAALVDGQMDPDMAQLVAHLATGLLPSGSCGCERSDRIIAYWRFDVTQVSTDNSRSTSPRSLSPVEQRSPFGFSRGGLWAWSRIENGGLFQVAGASI